MKQTSMILMSDFYKQAHAEQYPEGITKLISYATARMTRMPDEMYGDKLTVFGIQAYVKDFLIERFNDTFFNVPLEEAMAEYEMIIGDTFPLQYVNTGKFEALHKLGYLPVEVGCLAEGTRVPIRSAFKLPEGQCQVPFMYIINTHPDFPWITEFLESVTSSEVWYPMAIANQAYYYRQIVNKWYGLTGVADEARKSAISEFGFRGGKSSDASIKASSAFLTSFNKTATIPAIKYMHDYYGDPVKEIGGGMISTEHSVMCSNYAVDMQKLKENAVVVKDDEVVMSPKEGVVYYSEKADKLFVVAPLDKKPSINSKYVIERWINIINENNQEVWASYIINLEGTFLKKLFGQLYPAGAVSVVMDTYDYWANLQRCGETAFTDHRDIKETDLVIGNLVRYTDGVYEVLGEYQGEALVDGETTFFVFDKTYKFRKLNLEEVIKHGGKLADIILSRPGTVFFRGDSGDPVDIICGINIHCDTDFFKNDRVKNIVEKYSADKSRLKDATTSEREEYFKVKSMQCKNVNVIDKETGRVYQYFIDKDWNVKEVKEYTRYEVLGTVGLLWEMFGGVVNEVGYKVLNPHVRAIYGDSITPNRANQIYKRLAEKKFASNNVALGAGSFSAQCAETTDGQLLPFTRDSYGIAVKATWCQDKNGNERQLFKNPKTDTGKFKKSQRGLIWVGYDENGEIIAKDGYTSETLPENSLLEPIFRDGKMVKEISLSDVRNKLHNGDF